MKLGTYITRIGIFTAGALGIFLMVARTGGTGAQSGTSASVDQPVLSHKQSTSRKAVTAESSLTTADGPGTALNAGWINNEGNFTAQTAQLLKWVESGHPLDLRLGDGERQRYAFRETRIIADGFQISSGPDSEFPSSYRVFNGRRLGTGSGLDVASLAIVNGAASMAISHNGQDFLVETDPETGELYAVALQSLDNSHSCGNGDCGSHHTVCEISPDGIASINAPHDAVSGPLPRIPVSVVYPGDISAAEEPRMESGTANKPYLRNGSEYDASLKDILILMVSAKSQSGATSGLSSKAASYFATAARTAAIYERQLGMRYLLQEMILVPSDSSHDDPGNPSGTTLGDDLYHVRDWANLYRPQSTYKWGHLALWTIVYNSASGTVGLAWTDGYGSSYGYSTQEANWGWSVHSHELGHNVGSTHTSGGVMNPSLISGNEDFFTYVSGQTYTAAKDIYNYMSSSIRGYVFGPADLRHPEEIPFGVDDSLSTPTGSAVIFDPLTNDLTKIANGTPNTLRLVEVGQVSPKSAGTARVVNDMVEFIPAPGFTGQAWFTYTVGGDVGNLGKGWLHRADVVVTVGGNSTTPSQSPLLSLTNDIQASELSSPIRFNPLLNDEGSGYLWSGDVHVVLSPSASNAESYSARALRLVNAVIIKGTGSLSIETMIMTRGSSTTVDNTGYMTYTPGQNESGQVIIEYTVMDAGGNTATARAIFAEQASVKVVADYLSVAEDSGDVITLTFSRSATADLSVAEWIDFVVGGTTSPTGSQADYALAGQDSFDPISGSGTVLIPAGETDTTVLMAIVDDGLNEGQETFDIDIVATSLLLISSSNSGLSIWIDDDSLVYEENFDSFNSDPASWNGWLNLKDMRTNGKGGDDFFDWSVELTTPTAGTGPTGDHTSGSGRFLFAEATANTGSYTILESASINTSGVGDGLLEFWYNMYGSGMGTLTVDLYANGSLVAPAIWSSSGQQSTSGSDWKNVVINLASYLPATSLQVRFRADIGSTELSDVAIDDFKISAKSSALPQTPSILADPAGCTVEQGQSVYLSVIPQGFPAPQVHWYRNGSIIPGATSAAYFIPSVDDSSTGTYEAVVSNSEGTILSYPANIEMSSPGPGINEAYNTWSASLGYANDKLDDPDRDGLVNVLEFAFNSDPLDPAAIALPVVSSVAAGGQTYLEITFFRREDHVAEEVVYTVQTSTTMASGEWVTGSAVQEMSAVPVTGGEMVTVRRVAPLGNGCAFLRVNVELSPAPSF